MICPGFVEDIIQVVSTVCERCFDALKEIEKAAAA